MLLIINDKLTNPIKIGTQKLFQGDTKYSAVSATTGTNGVKIDTRSAPNLRIACCKQNIGMTTNMIERNTSFNKEYKSVVTIMNSCSCAKELVTISKIIKRVVSIFKVVAPAIFLNLAERKT